MKVEIEEMGFDSEALVVRLDDGTEVGVYTIVDNPEEERLYLEQMLKQIINEALEQAQLPVPSDGVGFTF